MKLLTTITLCLLVLIQPAFAVDSSVSFEGTSQYSKQLLKLINNYRESKRLKPLFFDTDLTILARSHSVDMQQRGALSHDRFEERFKKSGHNSCVENVGWNYRSSMELFEAWQDSRGHDQNMLAADIKRAGISLIGTYVTFFACN